MSRLHSHLAGQECDNNGVRCPIGRPDYPVRCHIDPGAGLSRLPAEVTVEGLYLVRPRFEGEKLLPPVTLVRVPIDDDGGVGEPERPVEVEVAGPQG